ncbi:asparaginase [Variovorax sp. PCZ-1]|uniref:asparaginase n=1 Tax=Variovorax sp. PCZ-1 TaxID=2835533 RepID=UPI001BCE2846|nr:asparaginase [Variovorax sp. PCZ-1]MBS7806780.1 asparaginase [Variovorax sp. PCZ-1]
MTEKIVVLGTGGTIAGTAASSSDHTGYTAAQIGITSLLQSVPGLQEALQGRELVSEQLAQLDSKDMDFDTMRRLAQSCVHHLAQPEVRAIVITHGTDTLEETAYFLHRVIPIELQAKPVVLTCAMRPATSSEADGPRNLRDAVLVAGDSHARGVLSVCAGDVHSAKTVQKVHTYALNAFSSGDVALGEPGVVAQVVGDQVLWKPVFQSFLDEKRHIDRIESAQAAIDLIVNTSVAKIAWPRVEIVLNHAQATGSIVRALLAEATSQDPLCGIVVAGTGNGTVSESLQSALNEAQPKGVEVIVASRCAWGGVHDVSALSAVKARIDLMLKLLRAA